MCGIWITRTPKALFKFFASSSFQYDKAKMFSNYSLHANILWWCETCWGAGIRHGVPSLHQEFKSVVVIKRFMSYLKSAGVSKVNRALWTHFSAGAVDLTGVCFRKPDVCVWNLLFATKCFFFFPIFIAYVSLSLYYSLLVLIIHHRHYGFASYLN